MSISIGSEAYQRGVKAAEEVMEQGRRDLEAQAAEEALENEGKIPYNQKMAAMRSQLKRERLEREARTNFKDGRPLNWSLNAQ